MKGWKGGGKEWSENGRNKIHRNGRGRIGRRMQDGVERTDITKTHQRVCRRKGEGVGVDQRHILRDR